MTTDDHASAAAAGIPVEVAWPAIDTLSLRSPALLSHFDVTDQLEVVELRRLIQSRAIDSESSHSVQQADVSDLVAQLNIRWPYARTASASVNQVRAVADETEHDRYFRIERVSGAILPIAIRSVLEAKLRFHRSMASGYEACDQGAFSGIETAFGAALSYLLGETPIRLIEPDMPTHGRSSEPPARRWVVGHQIFAALTQSIILALRGFETALASADTQAASVALDLAATLLLASASAFRFTADFSVAAYRDEIRPSMGPQHVGRGFSGLLSEDHRVLVETMTRIRPLMATAAAMLPEQQRRLRDALAHVYDDHKFVCARFGGNEGSSLRSDACSEVPGTVLLQRFKRARTRLLVPVAVAP